jgi:hypothetical protein
MLPASLRVGWTIFVNLTYSLIWLQQPSDSHPNIPNNLWGYNAPKLSIGTQWERALLCNTLPPTAT